MSQRSQYNKKRQHQESIYSDLPFTADKLQLTDFGEWIIAQGGTCIPVTNEYEVARWELNGRVAIIYHNRFDELTWTIPSAEDYREFRKSEWPRHL